MWEIEENIFLTFSQGYGIFDIEGKNPTSMTYTPLPFLRHHVPAKPWSSSAHKPKLKHKQKQSITSVGIIRVR